MRTVALVMLAAAYVIGSYYRVMLMFSKPGPPPPQFRLVVRNGKAGLAPIKEKRT
jgi:hypothetical protein